MSDRDLNNATTVMKWFIEELIKQSKDKLKIPIFVTSVSRTFQLQVALYAQGRQTLEEVNLLRLKAGVSPITAKENKKITWTLASKHIINLLDSDSSNDKAHAVDIGVLINGKYLTEDKDCNANKIGEYTEVGLLGEQIGGDKIKWGGRFKNSKGMPQPDNPHFEEA